MVCIYRMNRLHPFSRHFIKNISTEQTKATFIVFMAIIEHKHNPLFKEKSATQDTEIDTTSDDEPHSLGIDQVIWNCLKAILRDVNESSRYGHVVRSYTLFYLEFLYAGHINKGVFTQADNGTFLNWAAGILMTVFTGSDDDDNDDDNIEIF